MGYDIVMGLAVGGRSINAVKFRWYLYVRVGSTVTAVQTGRFNAVHPIRRLKDESNGTVNE